MDIKPRGRLILIFMAAMVAVGHATSASAQERAIPVMIQTVPPISGVELSVDGERTLTDETGLALVTVEEPGSYEVSIGSAPTNPLARASFALWSDGSTARNRVVDVSSFTFLQAGFEVGRNVDFSLLDDAGRPIDEPIDSITIVDNTGRARSLEGDSASWVPGNRLVSESDELTSQPLSWRIAQVVVEGKTIDRIDATEFSAGEGLWSVRLDPDSAATDADGEKDDESVGGAWLTEYLYLIIAALLFGGTMVIVVIMARRGSESPRNWRVAWRPRLRGVLRAVRPNSRDFAAPFKWMATRLRGRLQRRPAGSSQHLRVRMKSGNTLEGWTDPYVAKDKEALRLVSVTRVLDKAGQPIPFQPRDAFVLRSRIASLEILMTSPEGPRVLLQPEEEHEAEVIDLREEKGTHAR